LAQHWGKVGENFTSTDGKPNKARLIFNRKAIIFGTRLLLVGTPTAAQQVRLLS
jgi:hypothetical protein